MSANPPPIGPDLGQWAQGTRRYLQRWIGRLPWKTADDNPSENGVMRWDESIGFPVVSKSDAFVRFALLSDIAESIIVVKEASQLSGALDSTKAYLIDGAIDMGSTQITVPTGGLTIVGVDFNVSSLTSSENSYTMFVSAGGSYSGDLILRNVQVTTSGTSSQVMDIDNNENGNALECTDVNFFNCTSLGEMTDYRQGLWSRVGIIQCDDGLTMSGNWSGGFAILDSIIVSAGVTFNGTLLKEGTSLSISGSVRSNMNALQLGASGEISDMQPSNVVNDAEFRMEGVRCNPSSTPFPNFPASSVKARFSKCVGFRNTYVGGQWSVTTAAATTISAANTPVKLAGTTTYDDLQWFDGSTDNAMKLISEEVIEVQALCVLTITGTNGDQVSIQIRKWDDSASSYTTLSASGARTLNAGGRAEGIELFAYAEMEENDRIEVWIENQTAARNVTAEVGGLFGVTERSS